MKISEIYQKYVTPPNLQQHQLLVTKVALQITNNWKGPNVNINNLKIAALLHDLANIVKFDFIKHPEFLGNEQTKINLWIEQQKQVITKYGNDDHEATSQMLSEIGVSAEIAKIIDHKSFGNAVEINSLSFWEPKILLYADMRVGPFGIVSLKDRIDDITTRLEKYKNRPDLPQIISACENIEKELQSFTQLNLSTLSEKDLQSSDAELLTTDL